MSKLEQLTVYQKKLGASLLTIQSLNSLLFYLGIAIFSFNGMNYVRSSHIKGIFRGLAETEDQDLVTLEQADQKYFVRY